jgi:hypothetical protein
MPAKRMQSPPRQPPAKILIISPRETANSRRIAAAAQAAGYTTVRFSSDDLPTITNATEVKVYCDEVLADYISQHSHVVLLSPLDDAVTQAPAWATKRRICCMPAAALRTAHFPCHVQPVDHTSFAAGIYAGAAALAGYIQSHPMDAVLVSDCVHFVEEYRSFLLDGHAIAATPMVFAGASIGDDPPPVPPAITACAENIAAACADHLPPACVIDIGVTDSGDTALIAFHPAWAANIFGADARACLPAILASCADRRHLSPALKRFETLSCAAAGALHP